MDSLHAPSPMPAVFFTRRDEGGERPTCGSGPRPNYDTGLHVFALFLILLLSTAACSFPIVVRRFPRIPVPHRFLFLSRHFGTGVLIATAFVHLLPTAFVSLTDPCLAPFWNKGYPAMAGFIAMLSVLVVVGVEMFFATKGAGHVHGADFDRPDEHEAQSGLLNGSAPMAGSGFGKPRPGTGSRRFRTTSLGYVDDDAADVSNEHRRGSNERGLMEREEEGFALDDRDGEDDASRDSLDDLDPEPSSPARLGHRKSRSNGYAKLAVSSSANPPSAGAHTSSADEQAVAARLLLQCLLLEAGILFHSVFIGMAVSVATGPAFIVLLVAISFHQTFEGFALGSRIAAIPSFGPGSLKPWLMALAYGTTTPIGQAIGLLVHNLYDPASEAGLLIVGMNSISSGLLLFAGLVELLAEDFLREETYVTLRGRKRIEACAAVVCGALLMALVGAFA